ncbi:class I SAM-dependent methyltransferase [Kribbella sp. NBC_00889]|uniref:class I SAM-dependent methyltransferase n=1 Tax=Kribbella sp. NBC_00889 TaxID=2975974 RepID=UPI0038682EFE|nr:class I SAM-dependent methyltransferase [Kribbella sp. NBC_00889]
MRVGQGGTGPGPHTPDGSAIELYEATPAHGEDELINAAMEPGSSILELGCGTGRITRPLLALGHQVVAVDESPDMVARVTETETICSTIGDLRLDRHFDVVLMMSYLINVADDDERLRLLRTCAHHVRPRGAVLLQQQIPGMIRGTTVMENEHRRLVVSDVEELPGNRQAATLTHTIGDRSWSQRILTQNLSDDQLSAQLTEAGLTLADYLTPDKTWVRARRP